MSLVLKIAASSSAEASSGLPLTRVSRSMLKIVSGGQTGADRAALDWAIANQVPHGGWCPAGRIAEDGTISDRYQLQECPGAIGGVADHQKGRGGPWAPLAAPVALRGLGGCPGWLDTGTQAHHAQCRRAPSLKGTRHRGIRVEGFGQYPGQIPLGRREIGGLPGVSIADRKPTCPQSSQLAHQ